MRGIVTFKKLYQEAVSNNSEELSLFDAVGDGESQYILRQPWASLNYS